jgi:homoserine kinase
MAVEKGYGTATRKASGPRAQSAALRKQNIQKVASKLAKAGKPLTTAQRTALGIAGGLGVAAATLIGGAASMGRRSGGSSLNKTK